MKLVQCYGSFKYSWDGHDPYHPITSHIPQITKREEMIWSMQDDQRSINDT